VAFRDFPESGGAVTALRAAERAGDGIARELFVTLESTIVSPIEREDAFALGSALDDVVDHLDEAADELYLYGVRTMRQAALRQAALAEDVSALLRDAVRRLRESDDPRDLIEQLRRRETEADQVHRTAVGELFSGDADPLMVIRWKDIHEELEAAVNACEQAAEVLESIALKTR
jgi:uncharacterized protein Yka (UPF0111/DUF47 family)